MWNEPATSTTGSGRRWVAVIGIDRYRAWGPLSNAVRDAQGAGDAFVKLGFEPVGPRLFDEQATGKAIHRLVTKDLRTLGQHDSLVLFFAGHGYTVMNTFAAGAPATRGYLIPVDAEKVGAGLDTWLRVDNWLRDVSLLPPKHILVVLDSCHSGIAVNAFRYRGESAEPLAALSERRSRRIITSALAHERALDGGPVAGHSMFTGCLLDALAGGMADRAGRSVITASELGIHVRHRVSELTRSRQTPDFGELELDDGGELVIALPGSPDIATSTRDRSESKSRVVSAALTPAQDRLIAEPGMRPPASSRSHQVHPAKRTQGRDSKKPRRPGARHDAVAHADEPVLPADGPTLDNAFAAALDRHDAERKWGGGVLSIVTGDAATAPAGWATWAAGRGYLTLITEATGVHGAIADLLAQTLWLRSLPAARTRLAAAAQIDMAEVDAALDARSDEERATWIEDTAGTDQHARVSGWLLSTLREPRAHVPNLATAPVQGGELLSIVWDLAPPIAVLLHHPEPEAPWLDRAIPTAANLIGSLPRHPVAVAAPSELVRRVLTADRDSAALSMARQGLVSVAPFAQDLPDRARGRIEQRLHDALARDRRTRGQFQLNVSVPIPEPGRTVEVDLMARGTRLVVEIDRWYHVRDAQAYRRDRDKGVQLSRAGFFVMRFLAEEVEQRLELVVDEIAIGLLSRRASRFSLESSL